LQHRWASADKASLAGQVAFITGAGRGIGEAIAKAFSRAGTEVALLARTASEVRRVASEIEAGGGRALALAGDVSVLSDVENSVAATLERFGRIDVLVNCAGILGPIGCLVNNSPQAWTETIQVNLLGTMFCIRAVLPCMTSRRKGVVVNLSGGGSVTPFPRFSAYSASKAAVVRLTETIAEEVKEYGIRVNAISPGVVNTRMLDETLAAGEAAGSDYRARIAKIKAEGGVPPERAAELAVFLASPEAAGITGRLISAVWDDWKSLPEHAEELSKSSMFTLRRIDGRHFVEIVSRNRA
jgi:3-oxoacyl-[acyl-carrier protein] reductase